MNLAPDFTHSPEFCLFKKAIGHPSALEFLFNLGAACQVKRKAQLFLPADYFGPAMGLPDDLNSETVKQALIQLKMIEAEDGKEDLYTIRLFTDHNAGLIADWNNGRRGGRPKAAESKESSDGPTPSRPTPKRSNVSEELDTYVGGYRVATPEPPRPSSQSKDEDISL